MKITKHMVDRATKRNIDWPPLYTEFISAINEQEAHNFSDRCQRLHGEHWQREWAARKAKGGTQ